MTGDSDRRALSGPSGAADPAPRSKPGRLHQPWRALVALVEVVLACLAVWLAFVAWSKGVTTITATLEDGTVARATRYHGNWIAASIGLGAVASLLVLDAVREVLLAVRTRRFRRRSPERAAWPERDQDGQGARPSQA